MGLQQSRVRIQHPHRQRRDQPGARNRSLHEVASPARADPLGRCAGPPRHGRLRSDAREGRADPVERESRGPSLIKAIVFDLDNTLTYFMKMKSDAIHAAIDGMIDAGLNLPRELVRSRIDAIYQDQG